MLKNPGWRVGYPWEPALASPDPTGGNQWCSGERIGAEGDGESVMRYFRKFWQQVRSGWLVGVLCGVVVLGQPLPARYAQQAPRTPNRPGATPQERDPGEDVIRITNVTVPVIVTDQDDRFISKLTKDDFEIYENKKKQKIESFEDKTDLPLFVAVLMDTSASIKPKLKFQKEATISFLQTIIRRRKDQALFVTFDSTVQLRQDFTDDTNLLAKAIMEVKASGDTALYDAVYRVCEEKMYNVPTPRKIIIVITDGADTASEHTLEEAIEIAQRYEVLIFGISTRNAGFFGTGAGMVAGEDDEALRKLCTRTGGDVAFPQKVIDLERAFQRIDQAARRYYLLSYEPQDPDTPGYRKIEVRVVTRKNVKVKARDGYMVRRRAGSAGSSL
ncbi:MULTISPECIES: VWA domain-containing protein [Chloracidobacterium]|jgi:Ca-activated chloride channel family protein|nr:MULTISPECIES: VWA domain-containing protein [Chloracidobacterium]QUV79731.1 VWA domain-containing protein [Chloracidobacterium thermophilum]